jgi:hypothetical protein
VRVVRRADGDYSYMVGNQFAKGSKPNATAFKKGNVPWIKGRKGLHHSPATEFKKGHPSNNKKPVGAITIRIDKNKAQRRWIKVDDPNIWIEHAKFIWIKNNGEIPKGYIIHHVDEDSLNDDPGNLALVTRAAHINLHRHTLMAAKQKKQKPLRQKILDLRF